MYQPMSANDAWLAHFLDTRGTGRVEASCILGFVERSRGILPLPDRTLRFSSSGLYECAYSRKWGASLFDIDNGRESATVYRNEKEIVSIPRELCLETDCIREAQAGGWHLAPRKNRRKASNRISVLERQDAEDSTAAASSCLPEVLAHPGIRVAARAKQETFAHTYPWGMPRWRKKSIPESRIAEATVIRRFGPSSFAKAA